MIVWLDIRIFFSSTVTCLFIFIIRRFDELILLTCDTLCVLSGSDLENLWLTCRNIWYTCIDEHFLVFFDEIVWISRLIALEILSVYVVVYLKLCFLIIIFLCVITWFYGAGLGRIFICFLCSYIMPQLFGFFFLNCFSMFFVFFLYLFQALSSRLGWDKVWEAVHLLFEGGYICHKGRRRCICFIFILRRLCENSSQFVVVIPILLT